MSAMLPAALFESKCLKRKVIIHNPAASFAAIHPFLGKSSQLTFRLLWCQEISLRIIFIGSLMSQPDSPYLISIHRL